MSSLTSCIKKAGKALNKDDAELVRQVYEDLVAEGVPNPAQAAVTEVLESLKAERQMMIEQIELQGGRIPPSLVFAKPSLRAIAEKISIVGLLDGDERLEIPDAKVTKAGKIKATARQLAIALVERTKRANRGKPLSAKTPRTKEIVAEAIAIETEAAINRSGHAGDWYSSVLVAAVNIAAEIHPELKTDVNMKNIFMLGLAITSNGNTVADNARAAEEVYAHFKKTGQFLVKDYGNQGTKPHFELANAMLDRWGVDTFVRFLNTDFTIGELTKLGFTASGDQPNFQTKGSAVFGPKIGAGFFQNLMGNFDPITMDRWFMRTWGRLTGTLMPLIEDVRATDKFDRFVQAVRDYPEQVKALGFDPDAVLATEDSLLEFAAAVHKAYAKSSDMWWGEVINDKKKVVGERREFDSQEERDAWIEAQQEAGNKTRKGNNTFADKNELNYAGKNLDMAINAPIIAPVSGAQRAWIREVTELALEKLVERGVPANSASMQALVWYPEKDLYLDYGVGSAKSAPTDYAQEFAKLALERGISQRRIDAARADVGRAGDVRPAAEDTGTAAVERPDAPTLGKKGKARLAELELFRGLREQLPRSFRDVVPKGKERLVDGVPVKKLVKPLVKLTNVLKKLGMARPHFAQLDSEQGAQLFHDTISDVAERHPQGAAVHVYGVDDYKEMKLYIAPDKSMGFAVTKTGDIVSVFKDHEVKASGAAHSMILAALAEGGVKLDAFDTVLPFIYSLQGFRVVSRIPWSDAFAPMNWDKDTFSEYRAGEPDVVFMVYDRNHKYGYTGQTEGQLVDTYEDAVEIQDAAVEDLAERNILAPNLMLRIDEETRQAINNDPTGAVPQLAKLQLTAEEQTAQPGTAPPKSWWYAKLKEAVDNGRIKAFLAAVPRRALVDFLPTEFVPNLKKYLQLSNQQEGRRNEILSGRQKLADRWVKWVRANKEMAAVLSEVMHTATLVGMDPSKKYRPLKDPSKMTINDKRIDMRRRENFANLQKIYSELPTEAHELFEEVRDDYIAMREEAWEALKGRIKASEASNAMKKALLDRLRMTLEAGRVKGVYFPLMRYGDWWAAAKDSEGNVISFSKFETRDEMQQWAANWREDGFTTQQGKISQAEMQGVLNKVDPSFVSDIVSMMDKTGNSQLKDDIWQMYMDTLPEMSIRKQFMHRKGRIGYAQDALRAYATVSYRHAGQVSKIEYNHQRERALADLRKDISNLENDPEQSRNLPWATPLYDEVVARHKAEQEFNASATSTALTALGFLFYLGFSPAAAMVNFSQTPLVGLPVIAGKFGYDRAGAELTKAFALWSSSRGPLENRLRGEEKAALVQARKDGLIETSMAYSLAQLTERDGGIQHGAQRRFMEASAYMFHTIEVGNREMTFLAAYRAARKDGMSHTDAITLAQEMTWDAHFDYSNPNRPRIMQNDVSRVILLFKQYSLNMTYRLARDFRDGFLRNPDISATEKKEARRRFGGMMVMSFLLSGTTGMWTPVKGVVDLVLKAILSDDEDDDLMDADDLLRAYLFEALGEDEFAEWASHFVSRGVIESTTGFSISQRTSLSNLWFNEPYYRDTPQEQAEGAIVDLTGPVAGYAITGLATAGNIASHIGNDKPVINMWKEAENFLPKAAKDISKAIRGTQQGVTKRNIMETPIIKPEEYGLKEFASQSIGFTPALQTERSDRRTAVERAKYLKAQQRQSKVDRVVLAQVSGDKKELAAAWQAVHEWNRTRVKSPTDIITSDTIRRSYLNRLKGDVLSDEGINLDPRDWYLMDNMIWTTEQKED